MIILVIILTGFTSLLITRGLVTGSIPLSILDQPNERSLHTKAVPRTGGVAILSALLFGVLAGGFLGYLLPAAFSVLVALIIIAVCSFADDAKGLSVSIRLVIHLVAVGLLVRAGYVLDDIGVSGNEILLPSILAVIVTVLFVIWSINFYNFMDGMDGFAVGMTVIGFGTLAIVGLLQNEVTFATVNACLVASVSGFWAYNFPPAKIFMGDLGSSLLGFCFAVVSIWGVSEQIFSIWIPCIVFSPFIVDATYTLGKRALRGERFWEAHKTHFYQRLVEVGYGHKKVVIAEYCLMLLCSLTAIVSVSYEHVKNVQLIGILLTGGLYTVIILTLNKKLRS